MKSLWVSQKEHDIITHMKYIELHEKFTVVGLRGHIQH